MNSAKGRLVGSTPLASTEIRRLPATLAGLALLALAALAALPAFAQGAVTHKLSGTFNNGGALSQPGAMAVDSNSGSVYVVTGGNTNAGSSIEKYDAAGNPSNFSFTGTNTLSPCSFGSCIRQIAVDNSAGVNQGVIYIATTGSNIYVYLPNGQLAASYHFSHVFRDNPGGNEGTYCGVAVDGSGNLYIQHNSGFFEDGAYTDKFRPGRWLVNPSPPQIWPVAGIFQQPEDSGSCKVAADATQFLYTSTGSYSGTGTLKRWPFSAVNLVTPPSKTIDTGVSAFAANHSTNDLLADERTSVTRFDSGGNPLEVFGDGDLTNSNGVAVNSASGTVYVSDRGANDIKIYDAVTTPDVTNVDATTGQTTATISAHIDAAGAGNVTGCEVEYGTDATYGSTVSCSGSLPSSGGADVTAAISGLTVETVYHYRVRATNANGTTRSIDRTFMTHAVQGVATAPATDITRTSATLNGSYTGNGDPTTYHFEWGTDTSYGHTTPESSPSSASGNVSATADLTGLDVYRESSPPYHYRLVATNSQGTTYGPDMTFHTLPPNPPEISNQASSGVTPSAATVSADINPGLGDTIYVVQYGTSPSYGEVTPQSESIGSDDATHSVSVDLSGLTPGVTYHYRVVASNFGGSTYGPDQTFNTPDLPAINGASSAGVTQSAATLAARIRPAFSPTTYHFEYGTSAAYGATTPESGSIGADNVEHAVSQAIAGLNPGTTYHFRVVATNGVGTRVGPDQTFTTEAPPPPPPPPAKKPLKCKRGFVKRHGKCVRKKRHRKHRHHHHRKHHRHTGRGNG